MSAVGRLAIGFVLLVATPNRILPQNVAASPASVENRKSIANTRVKTSSRDHDTPANVLSADEWKRVDAAVDRALAWLAAQQQHDGSFPSIDLGQPGVTSLCAMAFLAHGHVPGSGPYAHRLDRALDYVLQCQKQNGLIALVGPEGPRIGRDVSDAIGTTAVYNHSISSLMLSETYGVSRTKQAEQMRAAISRALAATLEMQRWPKDRLYDRGGWRDLSDDGPKDSDLSVTGWQLMFLRSARNAGFDVPKQPIDDAVGYIRRSFDRRFGAFNYTIIRKDSPSRGMAGHGILALGHANFHNSLEAQHTGQWLMRYNFKNYNDNLGLNGDRYHYSLFTCCQGMYQLGSPYWERFFPPVVDALVTAQKPNGSWDAESDQRDRVYGNSYTTALVVLSLGAANQFLPIFQR